jgi:hypothetical protein
MTWKLVMYVMRLWRHTRTGSRGRICSFIRIEKYSIAIKNFERCRRHGVHRSDGKGNLWDNTHAESFFKLLKREVDKLEGRHTKEEVRAGYLSIWNYIIINAVDI